MTKLIGGNRVISNVKRVAADIVKRWSIIRKVNGVPIDEYEETNILPYIWHEKIDSNDFYIDKFLRSGPLGSEVSLELEFEGQIETVSLIRTKGDIDWVYNDIMPECSEPLNEVYKSDSHRIAMTGDNIAVITIDTMMNEKLPEEFFANFPLLEKASGYIIDIRNNGGGNSEYADAVATSFIEGTFTNQRALHPIHIGVYKAWGEFENFGDKTYEQIVEERGEFDWLEKTYKIPKHCYYEENVSTSGMYGSPGVLKAPLIVLTSALTASAAEDFLVELDYAKRAVIVGTASFGSTGQPLNINLESGGSFKICTRHNTYPDGREFLNCGVQPHVPFEMSLGDYMNGRDSLMEKGLSVVRDKIRGM
jgi:C-terminal processing protease CtpA/Prc